MIEVYRFLKSEEGATAVEYAVMLALIAGTIAGAVEALGQGSKAALDNFDTQFNV